MCRIWRLDRRTPPAAGWTDWNGEYCSLRLLAAAVYHMLSPSLLNKGVEFNKILFQVFESEYDSKWDSRQQLII